MTSIDGVTDVQTDVAAQTCSFKTTNAEIDGLLAEKAADTAELKGYSKIE